MSGRTLRAVVYALTICVAVLAGALVAVACEQTRLLRAVVGAGGAR